MRLRALGQHAHWGLLGGVVLALSFPVLGNILRPWLPHLVALVFALAVIRMDFGLLARALRQPREWAFLAVVLGLLMPVSAVIYWGMAVLAGLPEAFVVIVLMIAVGPPMSSAANFALILGYDAERALVLTVLGKALTPLIGPLMFALILPGAVDLAPVDMAQRLAVMIGVGAGLGIAGQALFGFARIVRNKERMDGLAVIGMVLILPALMDGLAPVVRAEPWLVAQAFGLVMLLNTGATLAAILAARAALPLRISGTLGLIWGNRNAALYLAALPPDPVVGLFVALYQLPMYAAPLILRTLGLSNSD